MSWYPRAAVPTNSVPSPISLNDTTEELAAYRKANPSGKITLTPLYVEQILTMMIIGLHPRPKVI